MNNEKDNKDSLEEAIDNFSEKPQTDKVVETTEQKDSTVISTDDGNAVSDNAPKKKKLSDKFKSKAFKRGWISLAFTCLFIAAVIIVNMVAGVLVEKVPALKADLTASGTYQLTADTTDFLQTLSKDVKIMVLAPEGDYTAANQYYLQANTLLKMYPQYSTKISLEYIDLTANPTFANDSKYKSDSLQAGDYIVECGDKHRVLTTDDLFEQSYDSTSGSSTVTGLKVESAVTTAILNVTSDSQTKVQFIDGFGTYTATGFTKVLESNNYDVSNVALLTGNIGDDTSMIILFTPSVDLDESSAKKINDFLYNKGEYGKNLLYVASQVNGETPVLDSLLAEWGVEMAGGMAMEMDENHLLYSNSYAVSTTEYGSTDYTAGLKDSTLNLVAGYIRPVVINDQNKAVALLTTTDSAKLLPYDATDDFSFDNVTAEKYSIATMSTKTSESSEGKSNVAVFGSALIFDDSALQMSSYNNSPYILNMFNILTDHADDGIAIEGKNLQDNQLGIVASQTQLISTIFIGLIPLAIIILGLIIWLRRRNK
ncbi:MAG TPA: hypothetical protein GX401_08430 [Clostridiales bacterium]|nr:hypothetical protein [Clostridiales bacterium]